MLKSYDVVIKPVISEKSLGVMDENKYTFIVNRKANKAEIKKAVEELFNVTVLKVNTLKVPRKKRRQGRYEGYTSQKKKAIVTLKEGDSIEVFEGL